MDVAQLISTARQQRGMTQLALAERAGVSRTVIGQVESGARVPSIPRLTALLEALGYQLRVELEPLDADLRREIDALVGDTRNAEWVASAWSRVHGLAAVPHRIEGLAAAALLGAPVPVHVVEVGLVDSDATVAWLREGLAARAFRLRPPSDMSGSTYLEPTDVTRADDLDRFLADCPDRRFTIMSILDELRARLAPAQEVARHVLVRTESGAVPVQPLPEVSSSDPRGAQLLRLVQEGARGESRAEGQAPTRYPPR